jgi:prepilin-type processing-associated H-X9-DG protein
MDTLTSLSEEILYISDEPAPKRRAWGRWRVAGWVGAVAVTVLVMLPLVTVVVIAVRESWREQCAIQLKRIGVAFHEYHEAHEHFPAPSLASRDGRPLLSWRVALLPHLGYKSLYERFHLDEPWDSPHNRALLAEMPPEFACPAGPGRRAGQTGYLVIVGPITEPGNINTPFEPTRGAEVREFTDGTSNTVLVFETDALVPWTKPDDLRWERDGPLPRLASPHAGGTHVVFADGSTRFLKRTITPNILLAFLTMNGNEVLGGG